MLGLAPLIAWLKRALAGDVQKLGPFQAAALVIRSTVAVVALHTLQILLWPTCYRALCLPSWESAFYYSATSYNPRSVMAMCPNGGSWAPAGR